MLTGFYRETVQKGRRYINISEAIIDVYKTSYEDMTTTRDRVQVLKGRRLLSQKVSDTLGVKLAGGPTLSIYVDIVKNQDALLDMETLNYYDFFMEEPVQIDNRQQYVISFRPRVVLPYALYYGKLYIDRDKLSFTRAEFSLSMDNKVKAVQAILAKKPYGLRFKPQPPTSTTWMQTNVFYSAGLITKVRQHPNGHTIYSMPDPLFPYFFLFHSCPYNIILNFFF